MMVKKPSYEELEQIVREQRNIQNQFKELFENANDLIQSVDRQGNFLFVNKKWRETLGYTESEVQKLEVWDIIHPDYLNHCKDIFQKVFSGESVDSIEAVFISKQGDPIPVDGNASCSLIEGEPESTIGIFRDTRKRKQTEKALKQAHEEIENANRKLALAYAQMREWKDRLSAQLGEAEIAFLVDKDGRILGATEAAQEFFGLNRIQILRKDIMDLAAPGHRRVLQLDLQRAWSGIPGKRSIVFVRESNHNQQCDTKIMQVNLESVKMLLFLLRESS